MCGAGWQNLEFLPLVSNIAFVATQRWNHEFHRRQKYKSRLLDRKQRSIARVAMNWKELIRKHAEAALAKPPPVAVPEPVEEKPTPKESPKDAPKDACPYCHRAMDMRRCWKCYIAVCECGKPTESSFLTVCRY